MLSILFYYMHEAKENYMVLIEIEQVKKFMAGFLGGNLFDDFLMNEGKLSMDIAYEFSGRILKEFFDTDEWEQYGTYLMFRGRGRRQRFFLW